jgi:hypothetical protein
VQRIVSHFRLTVGHAAVHRNGKLGSGNA